MLFRRLGAYTLTILTANAFKDASPFFLFSSSEFLGSPQNLMSAEHLTQQIAVPLESCPSDTYIIVSQPGVEATDYTDLFSAPHLRQKMSGDGQDVRSRFTVKDVFGIVNADDLSAKIQQNCGAGHLRIDASSMQNAKECTMLTEYIAKIAFLTAGSFNVAEDMRPRVINLDFPVPPPGTGRAQRLVENDAFLASVLDLLASKKYTVLYTTSPSTAISSSGPVDSEPYEMDPGFQNPLHTDLKRDLTHHKRASDGNITLPDGPLFERYQYLTPGLFMGLLVSFILISILYVGVNGVASLQVSYAAFDKEMGPATQKK